MISMDDVRHYLSTPQAIRQLRLIEFWNGNRVRGDLEKLVTGFANYLYAVLYTRTIARHGACPPQRKPLEHPGLIILHASPQPDILAWRQAIGADLAAGMVEGRKVLRDKCLGQIAWRPWLKTFAPLMLAECVAVDRHGIGLYVHVTTADLARPSIQVRPLKGPGLNLDGLEHASARRPRAKRR
ncbi:MAG TPA: hypothetical protein VK196_03350 [Magnetospirillum sp.]|nr:hypothetical protein [Magnetospirillum sp.]